MNDVTLDPVRSLRILQWNSHSVRNKVDSLKVLSKEYDILFISESWLTPDTYFNIPDFYIFRKDSVSLTFGGLLFAIRKDIPYSLLEDSLFPEMDLEFQAVQIHYRNFDLSIFSIYRHPQCSLSRREYIELFDLCDSYSHVLLLGDFNAHHSSWGCERGCPEGARLHNAALDHFFSCLNDGSATLLTRPGQMMSAIDLSFASPLVVDLCEWSVLEDTYCSNHFPTVIKFNHTILSRPFFSHRVKFSTHDWNIFIERLHASRHHLKMQRPMTGDNAIENYEIFINHIKSLFPHRSDSNRGCHPLPLLKGESNPLRPLGGRINAKRRLISGASCSESLRETQLYQTTLLSKGKRQFLKKSLNRKRERVEDPFAVDLIRVLR